MTEAEAGPAPAEGVPARSGFPAKAGAAAIFLLLVCFCLFALNSALRDNRLEYPRELELATTAEEVKVPTGLREELVALLGSQPLHQKLFNLFYVIEVKRGVDQPRRDRLTTVLGELGWRANAAQQNLILEAVTRNDLRSAVLRADGLLRRGRLTAELLPVMRVMEQEPEAAKMLLGRLGKNPEWRRDYFSSAEALSNPEAGAARLGLFRAMLDGGMPLTRDELKPSLDAIAAAGDAEGALALVERLRSPVPRGTLNRDPDFAQIAALPAEQRRTSLPSEWELISKEGVSTKIGGRTRRDILSIRWNGAGAPVFARQLIPLPDGAMLKLVVTSPEISLVGRLNRLSFRLACPDQMPLSFEQAAEHDQALTTTYILGGAPACEHAYLIIAGQPMDVDRRLVVEMDAIRLTAG